MEIAGETLGMAQGGHVMISDMPLFHWTDGPDVFILSAWSGKPHKSIKINFL